MEELDELTGPGPDLPGLRRLLDRVEVEPDVVDAACGRPDDRVEILEAVDEEGFGGGGIFLATAVGHRLPAAGLIERVLDRAAEPLEELQGRDAHFGEESVDVTGNEEPDLHRDVPPMAGVNTQFLTRVTLVSFIRRSRSGSGHLPGDRSEHGIVHPSPMARMTLSAPSAAVINPERPAASTRARHWS